MQDEEQQCRGFCSRKRIGCNKLAPISVPEGTESREQRILLFSSAAKGEGGKGAREGPRYRLFLYSEKATRGTELAESR